MKHSALNDLISLIDRKYEFVKRSSRETFLLDLADFLNFLRTERILNGYAKKFVSEVETQHDTYVKYLREEIKEAIEIKKLFCKKFPALDDSDKIKDEKKVHDFQYDYTFSKFNDIIDPRKNTKTYPVFHDPMDDSTDVKKLLSILESKINQCGTKEAGKEEKEILCRFHDLKNLHEYRRKEFFNYSRTSPGVSLYGLEQVTKRINPKPDPHAKWLEKPVPDKIRDAFEKINEEKGYKWITYASYGVISKYANYNPENHNEAQLDGILEKIKKDLDRLYEFLRQEIGSTQINLQILNRYQMRCQFYNLENLRKSILARNSYSKKAEDILTHDLALYLFDQGIDVLYRTKFGKHETDLIDLASKHPMFIEVKAYHTSSSRGKLVSGIAQFHSYLSNLEPFKGIVEGYYVVYRLDGPIYELPPRVVTSRFTIYPILIDIGLSHSSGSRQKKPIIICENEILERVGKEAHSEI